MKNNGGSAFPRPVSEDRTSGDQPDGNRTISEQDGMSLRDWFAGQALAGLVPSAIDIASLTVEQIVDAPEEFAKMAYRIADAMLKAREARS